MPAGATKMTRKIFIDALNEDLSREYQAIIAYVNYSQVLKGAAYMNIAAELTVHAKQELDHALQIANHVDYLGGMPSVTPKPVKTSEKAEDMLKFDLENERITIANYRRRVKQADELIAAYGVAEKPSIVVNGKYRLNPVSAGGDLETIELVKWLVERENNLKPGTAH